MTSTPLSAGDHFLLMLDAAIRREGLAGNTCVARLRLAEPLRREEIQGLAEALSRREPSLVGRLRFSPLFQRPRWTLPREGTVEVRDADSADSLLNHPCDPRQDAPAVLYRLPDGIALRWHHALMDEKGAEAALAGRTSPVSRAEAYQPELAGLRWWQRWRVAQRMRRALREIDELRPVHFPHLATGRAEEYGVRMETFSEVETAAILTRSTRLCGVFQRNLYFLAVTFHVLSRLVGEGGPLCIPLPVNLRKREWSPVAVNYLTFLHLVMSRAEILDLSRTVAFLKEKHTDMIRRGVDREMVALLEAGRALGLSRYQRERVSTEGRERVTAYYSNPGESEVQTFLGRPVLEFRAWSAIPARPGLGIFFGMSSGRLLLTVVSVKGVVAEEKVGEVVRLFRETL